ncbi:chromosome partitioning protein Spo0J [Luminiphilus syltensis NOR5-1B]|uniref:Probable chromosome-partitioning protein ParB n=1 Tax=Luminiphilus syltensis NOR5-1B TaxID=565045 RepID=B8KUD8_9GAMM|nr:ParB/RepB/Spo0J family partition protein [Luminiphilus syltensis]EED36409.1 chromosome partitioning protein Spo0J [Luminiphilus syltensis NOR5-1B]
MSVKKKKLNRGLDALLGAGSRSVTTPGTSDHDAVSTSGDDQLKNLPLDTLQRGKYQPRRDFDDAALAELADSIRAQGVMQPIVARALEPGRFEIIAGERRWRAAQLAGIETIPAVIRDVSDEAAIAMALIENIQRENLNPIEEASALKRLQNEFELSQEEVAKAVGKSRSAVANLMRLLSLEPETRELLASKGIDTGHAKVLLALEGQSQVSMAKEVAKKALSVRQTETRVKQALAASEPAVAEPKSGVDPDIQRLEQDLGERLGAAVAIDHLHHGAGKLTINYSSLDHLDGILNKIH